MLPIDTDFLSVLLICKSFAAWKEFFSRILRALCVLAVGAGQKFNRQGAKDAKNSRIKTVCGEAAPCVSMTKYALSAGDTVGTNGRLDEVHDFLERAARWKDLGEADFFEFRIKRIHFPIDITRAGAFELTGSFFCLDIG